MRSRAFLPLILLAGVRAAFGCSDPSAPYPRPKSDSNYDDPDDPAAGGAEGPGARVSDAGDSGPVCAGDRDCVEPLRCFYPLAAACKATGRCVAFFADACAPIAACTCGATPLAECAPTGFASSAIDPNGACAPRDAGAQ